MFNLKSRIEQKLVSKILKNLNTELDEEIIKENKTKEFLTSYQIFQTTLYDVINEKRETDFINQKWNIVDKTETYSQTLTSKEISNILFSQMKNKISSDFYELIWRKNQ